ncbi:hypothetical protein D3C72_1887400 [compost metagenome]
MASLKALSMGALARSHDSSGSSPNSVTSRAASAAATRISSSTPWWRVTPASSDGTRTAASRNTMAPAMPANCSQIMRRWRQFGGFRRVGPSALTIRPAQTTATTPETSSACSASRYSG